MNERINIILQCRLSSTRLPGKILKEVAETGKPLLHFVLKRLLSCKDYFDDLIISCPGKDCEEILIAVRKMNLNFIVAFHYWNGDEDDVLGRFAHCIYTYPCKYVVRATSDNPFLSRKYLKQTILDLSPDLDYIKYVGLPLGCAVEGTRSEIILNLNKSEKNPYHREHVLTALCEDNNYRCYLPLVDPRYLAPELRLTVDTQEDLDFVTPYLQRNESIRKIILEKK